METESHHPSRPLSHTIRDRTGEAQRPEFPQEAASLRSYTSFFFFLCLTTGYMSLFLTQEDDLGSVAYVVKRPVVICSYLCTSECLRFAVPPPPGCADRLPAALRGPGSSWSREGLVREGGSAPKRGRHSTIFFLTPCICAVAAW